MSKLPLVMRVAGGFSLLWAMFFLFTPMSALESWLVDSSLANEAGASAIRNAGFAFMCIGFMHIALTMEQFGTENLGTWAMAQAHFGSLVHSSKSTIFSSLKLAIKRRRTSSVWHLTSSLVAL